MCIFCFGMHSSSWPLPRLGALEYSMLCLLLALFPRAGVGIPFAFVTGFVAKAQAPPLLLGLRASLYRPNQWETYILCGRSDVTWSAWAVHRLRCKRFLFAAGCNRKELSKTTVSFRLRMPLPWVCWLSVMERSVSCPLCSVRSCCRSVSSL